MAEPAAPQLPKSPSPLRWVLIGCGVLSGCFVLGMASCGGIFYFIYNSSEPVAKVGEDYLRGAPELRYVLDSHANIKRNRLGWNVSVVNDGGSARFTYSISQANSRKAEAVVWLVRSGGNWSAVGARIHPENGEPVTIGKPTLEHRIDFND